MVYPAMPDDVFDELGGWKVEHDALSRQCVSTGIDVLGESNSQYRWEVLPSRSGKRSISTIIS